MPKIPLFGPGYKGDSVDIDAQERVNVYPEIEGPDAKNIKSLHGTPGCTEFSDITSGGVCRGMYASPKSRLFVVVGTKFIELGTDGSQTVQGTLTGTTGMVGFAENTHEIIIADFTALNGWIFDTDTDTFTQITDSDYPGGSHVCHINGRFVVNEPATGKFFWSDAEDGFTWDALNFATAEGSPDDLLALTACRNELYLIGGSTIETWYDTGNSSNLYLKVPGTLKSKGTAAKFSVVSYDDKVFWLGSGNEGQNVVWMSQGYEPVRISTTDIEYQISTYSDISDAIAFTYKVEGHSFYVLTFPTGDATWVFDISTGIWHQWAHLDTNTGVNDRCLGQCSAFFNGKNYVGSYEDGKVYELDLDTYTDAGQEIKRVFTLPHVHQDRNRIRYKSFELDMESGVGLVGVPAECGTTWTDAGGAGILAPAYDGSHTLINGMAELNSELYVTGDSSGRLFKWNGVDAWTLVLAGDSAQKFGLVNISGTLYAPSHWYEKLTGWISGASWEYSFPQAGYTAANAASYDVLYLNTSSKIYVVGNTSERLFQFNDAWFPTQMTPVSDQAGDKLHCGLVYNNEIYAAGATGILVKWNGADAWTTLVSSGTLDSNTVIDKIIEFGNEIYGITGGAGSGSEVGRVVKYDGAGGWTFITDKITGLDYLYFIHEVDGALVTGGNYVTGSDQHRCLYRVDADNSELVAIVYDATAGSYDSNLESFAEFNGYYVGSAGGAVFKWVCDEGGLTGELTNDGYDPKAMLQISNDGGHTWGSEQWVDIGKLGEYDTRVKWRRLGSARTRTYRVTISDPVKVAVMAAHVEVR